MPKLLSISILKWKGPEDTPVFFGTASDVSDFGFFQRTSVREMLQFVSRTIVQRTRPGSRQTVEHEGYLCHAHNRDGLGAIVVTSHDYPSRSAFCVINEVVDQFLREFGESWRQQTADVTAAEPMLTSALERFQDPAQADKLMKIQRDLDETKVILHRTIESMLERGEKLDNLVTKSEDLSLASQMFYKQARKSNSCCSFM
ncbi:unnamed protein product [Pedinophyceae sp. YPF-701]|nr:unnamed protein product [Pedinophyceae sp. YPF-701]